MKAQVQQHNGTPTLFLNDEPVFANCQLIGYANPKETKTIQASIQKFARNDIHIYSIDSLSEEWCGPRPDRASDYDFSASAQKLQNVLDADPDGLLLLRMGFETRWLPNNWWHLRNPDEVEVLSNGERPSASYASLVWQNDVKDFLKAYIQHLRENGLYDRVIGY